MDNVLVDFPSAFSRLGEETLEKYKNREDEIPGVFSLMDPIEGAIAAYDELSLLFETYILSTAPWENPTAWSDKLIWVKKYLGKAANKRLILTHHKNLNRGHYLVDDRTKNGADLFPGELIHFRTPRFPCWVSVVDYLKNS